MPWQFSELPRLVYYGQREKAHRAKAGEGCFVGNVTLKTKFVVLIVALVAVSLFANLAWTSANKRTQMENEMREKGQVLAQQMDAVWEFMASNQSRLEQISYTEEGVYQGLHCAIVGRSNGQLFTSQSTYSTKFVNFEPRNAVDMPDSFEADALTAFIERGAIEYYAIIEQDGEEVFRFAAPMRIEQNCLDCHGNPKGEIDVTGFPKEGWEIGDVGGAISLTMPLDIYRENERSAVVQDVIFFGGMLVVSLAIVYFALAYLVTRPLAKVQAAVEQVQTGNRDVKLAYTESSREINALAEAFNRMAAELSAMYENLEAQVQDRTAQLAQVNETLEQLRAQLEEVNEVLRNENRYKGEFLAMMSHELRTPLTSILAFTEMLNRESSPKSEKEAQTRREIEANSRALLFMINDILEMSRLDAGRTEFNVETVDLGDILGLVQAVVQPLANRNEVDFACDIDPGVPLVQGDFEKIRHVLENLCGNAVKFTPAGGSVRLHISYHPECDEVWLRVADTGIGIAKKDQQRVFERFVQADSSLSRRYNGTGLGLSLAKEYAEMHGGSISLESALGEGSVFTVRIPVVECRLDAGEENE